jgi:hypothetical protein
MSNTIDSVTLSYTGIDLFEQAVRAAQGHADDLNNRSSAEYLQVVNDALEQYRIGKGKKFDPIPQPPMSLEIQVHGNSYTMRTSDIPLAPFRDYPAPPAIVPASSAVIGESMGDGKYAAPQQDVIPLGTVVEKDGKKYRKCGRAGFGGLFVQWYEVL